MQNANADELSSFIGYDHDISGKLSVGLQLSGTRESPEGQGTISLLNGNIRGEAFDSANAMLALKGSQFTIKSLSFVRGPAKIAGNGDYNLKSRTFATENARHGFRSRKFSATATNANRN